MSCGSARASAMASRTSHARRAVTFQGGSCAATLAERFPVPINAESGGGVVSLTFVFAVAAIVKGVKTRFTHAAAL